MKNFFWTLLFFSTGTFLTVDSHVSSPSTYITAMSPTNSCSIENNTYDAGESLKYKLYYNWSAVWITAGHAYFNIKNDYLKQNPVYHMTCVGTSAKSFRWIYDIKDKYETYLDPTTSKPLLYKRDIKEGNYTLKNQFTFNHTAQEVTIDYRIKKGKLRVENETKTITPCTHDVLSSIYYVRSLDYTNVKKGDKIYLDVFVDGKMYPSYLHYLGKGEVKTSFGKFRCHKVSPSLISNDVFEEGENMIIWATDDENKLPLLIESKIKVGAVKAYLTKHTGIKHPLTSRVK